MKINIYTFLLRSISTSLALTITSCTPSVEQKAPSLEFKPSWKSTDTAFSDENTHPKIAVTHDEIHSTFCWWEIFGDTTLNELEQTALKNSPTLETAIARFREAVWTAGIYESDLYPTLSLNGNASRQRLPKDLLSSTKIPIITSASPTPTIPPPPVPPCPIQTISSTTVQGPLYYNLLDATLVVNYEADIWGRLWLTKKAYTEMAKAFLEDIDAVQLLLTYQVAKSYNTIRYYDIDIRLAEIRLACLIDQCALTDERYGSGINDKTLSLEFASRKEAIIAEIAELSNERDRMIITLAVLLGKAPNEFQMPTSFTPWSYATPPYVIPSEVLAQRPDIRRSLREIESSIALIGVAKTSYLPSISLTGLAGYESLKANRLIKWQNRIWAGSTSLGMLLLDGGGRDSTVNQAIASYDVKASEHIGICLQAIGEVEQALTTYIAREKELRSYIAQNQQDKELLQISLDRYTSGLVNFVDVLVLKEQEIDSMRAVVQAELSLQLASLELIKAVGGHWNLK